MTPETSYTLFPLGDAAVMLDFGNVLDEAINRRVLTLYQRLQQAGLPGVLDVVPAYSSLTVYYDPLMLMPKANEDDEKRTAFEVAADLVTKAIAAADDDPPPPPPRVVRVPVCYAPRFAPDLEELACGKGLPVEEVIRLHTGRTYRVYMLGFLPGFPYMGTVDERIATPRKTEPRPSVAPGSVGIAGRQTGIYPQESPGGWQIIGRTPLKLFHVDGKQNTLFQPGDEVAFYSITEDEFAHY